MTFSIFFVIETQITILFVIFFQSLHFVKNQKQEIEVSMHKTDEFPENFPLYSRKNAFNSQEIYIKSVNITLFHNFFPKSYQHFHMVFNILIFR